ncbi:MAG: cold-shock protein [Betaproteobacteria bacterium]
MQGVVISKLYGALGPYGFIRGEDGIDRFTVPSALLGMDEAPREAQISAFDAIEVGTTVEFVHVGHVKGPRAINVMVVRSGGTDLDDE